MACLGSHRYRTGIKTWGLCLYPPCFATSGFFLVPLFPYLLPSLPSSSFPRSLFLFLCSLLPPLLTLSRSCLFPLDAAQRGTPCANSAGQALPPTALPVLASLPSSPCAGGRGVPACPLPHACSPPQCQLAEASRTGAWARLERRSGELRDVLHTFP